MSDVNEVIVKKVKVPRSTIWLDKQKTTIVPHEKYDAAKRRICWLHLFMAHIIQDEVHTNTGANTKQLLLDLLDEAFNCGKRMDQKLAEYKKASNEVS